MQARYYDPVIGRFLANDPVGFASGGQDYFNRYSYTANNPVNAIDPDGKQVVTSLTGIIQQQERNIAAEHGGQNALAQTSLKQAQHGTAITAAVASLFVPGPEDAVLAVAGATKVGQGIKAAAGAIGKLFSKGGKTGQQTLRQGDSFVETVGDAVPNSDLNTTQTVVSGPKVEEFAAAMRRGDEFPAIKVDPNTNAITDGNHRAVASELTGIPIQRAPSNSGSVPTRPLGELRVDPEKF